jgi:hypothetical protein
MGHTSTAPPTTGEHSTGGFLPALTGHAWLDALLYGGFFFLCVMALMSGSGGYDD